MTLLLAQPLFSIAQPKCEATLCGIVTDAETQSPIAFAQVFIEENNAGAVTDEKGRFHFHNLCEGTYTIVSQHIGCPHVAKEVFIKGNVEVDFSLHHKGVHLEEIVVKEKSVLPASVQTERTLSGLQLNAVQGETLGDALQNLPGVTTLNTGTSIAKPVIRGLHSNRVLVLNNGVRQEGQQWGLDHGPEVDPYVADELKVIMGANSVRYGADALGGVILIEPKPLRETAGIGGEINLAGFSNGLVGVVSGQVDGHQKLSSSALAYRLQGTLKRGGNTQTPDYFLDNTGLSEKNISAALGLQKEGFGTEVFYSLFTTDLGILRDAHIGNLTDLQNAIERGRPIRNNGFSYQLDRPLQRVAHHLLKVKSHWEAESLGKLSLVYARQFNRRQEFDAHKRFGSPPTGFDNPEIEFEITTHTLDVAFEHAAFQHFSGTFGAQWMHQVNTTDRGGLIPNYSNQNIGVYWIERWRKYPFPLELEGGIRFDSRSMDIERRGADVIDRQLEFNNASGTFGAVYHFPKYLKARLHAGSAWRAPAVNELYSDGVHHGSASFELGSEDLTAERATNLNLGFDLSLDGKTTGTGLTASLAFYQNRVDNFIYLEPQDKPVLTIRGAFPAFHYVQTDARLRGLDWQAEWRPVKWLSIGSAISILRARNLQTDDWLVFMPADSYRHSMGYYFDKNATEPKSFLKLTMENVARQTRAPEGQDYTPPPPGFTLFEVEGGTQLNWFGQSVHLGLTVQNVFNKSYRSYLNRLRYYAAEQGRNVAVRIKLEF